METEDFTNGSSNSVPDASQIPVVDLDAFLDNRSVTAVSYSHSAVESRLLGHLYQQTRFEITFVLYALSANLFTKELASPHHQLLTNSSKGQEQISLQMVRNHISPMVSKLLLTYI